MILMDPANFEEIENTIHAWFADSIQAPVVWAHQSAPRPEYPYGTLNIIAGPQEVFGSWAQVRTTDLGRPLGKEILAETASPCTMTVSCQAFVNLEDSRNPLYNARMLVSRAMARLRTLEVNNSFLNANISVVRSGPVQNLNAVINDGFVSRAAIDVIFNMTLSYSEYIGYIKTIETNSSSLFGEQEFGDLD